MKKTVLSYVLMVMCILTTAQTPESFNYQAIVRNTAGEPMETQNVFYIFSIVKGTLPGSVVYSEKHSTITNQFGLVTLSIGKGTDKTDDFTAIDWGADIYSLKVEIDLEGDGSYVDMGTTQLLSVPYALHAKTSSDSFSGDYNELINVPATRHIDSTYMVELTRADEDYIDFGTFENFTNSSDWSVIEKVMMPAGTGSFGGWHFFRGKGWVDQEGDIAIQLTTSGIFAWCQQGGWKSVTHSAEYEEGRWYTICLQYDAAAHTLALYADSSLVAQITDVLPQDDSGNTNKLFWGGQDVDSSRGQGDLYSETSIIIAYQDWLRRKLTLTEIREYKGNIDSETSLFFSAKIISDSVIDGSGNGHVGINGNSPVFLTEAHNDGSDFNEPLHVNDDLFVAGNLVVGGTITGSIKIDTVHVSQITGLLGEGFTMSFPDILNNYATLEIPDVLTFNEKAVIISGPGSETERISVPLGMHDGTMYYREQAGVTMEYPLIFETGNTEDVNNLKAWFDNPSASEEDAALIIRNLAGTETSRWAFRNYIPDGYETGNDGRTRFKIIHNRIPDNVPGCEYLGTFGTLHSYNPDTDKRVDISGVNLGDMSCPAVEIDYENRTVTLTFDYQEGYQIYNWIKSTILGENPVQPFSIIETLDGINEISRRNYYESLPIKYEQFYGFGQDTKLKARVVIAFGFWEQGL